MPVHRKSKLHCSETAAMGTITHLAEIMRIKCETLRVKWQGRSDESCTSLIGNTRYYKPFRPNSRGAWLNARRWSQFSEVECLIDTYLDHHDQITENVFYWVVLANKMLSKLSDLIIMTETWSSSAVNNFQTSLPDITSFRCNCGVIVHARNCFQLHLKSRMPVPLIPNNLIQSPALHR